MASQHLQSCPSNLQIVHAFAARRQDRKSGRESPNIPDHLYPIDPCSLPWIPGESLSLRLSWAGGWLVGSQTLSRASLARSPWACSLASRLDAYVAASRFHCWGHPSRHRVILSLIELPLVEAGFPEPRHTAERGCVGDSRVDHRYNLRDVVNSKTHLICSDSA